MLSAKQRLAVQLKAQGLTDAEISRRISVGTATLRRWWKRPEVQKELEGALSAMTDILRENFLAFDGAMRQPRRSKTLRTSRHASASSCLRPLKVVGTA